MIAKSPSIDDKQPLKGRGQDHVTHFTARRYASAVYAVVMHPSVCPSIRLSQVGLLHQCINTQLYFTTNVVVKKTYIIKHQLNKLNK